MNPTSPTPTAGVLPARAYAAQSPTSGLAPFSFDRRKPGPHDVLIRIRYCGVCHTDIHFVRNDWGISIYPMVPGHEIVGGLPETQEMLDYCAANNITADIELIRMNTINAAYARMEKSDVKYRFVIDMATL